MSHVVPPAEAGTVLGTGDGPAREVREERPQPAAATPRGFRRDVQGVRGFALVLVLLCHAELPIAGGGFVGLDMFYVLSGFLITGLIVSEIERTGSLSVMKFYARRAKRLLPLAATVLAVVVVGALALYSPVRAIAVGDDVTAAALYFVNWRFIAGAVDYFAFEDSVSPVQHYWSLSVEEQFYLVWPVLLLAVAAASRRLRIAPRRALLIVIVLLGAASLAYCLWMTSKQPMRAYFSTLTRGWELAAGGVLALALPRSLSLPRWLGALLAGAGVAALVIATVIWTGNRTPYPGWRALIPALATVAVIVAGTATRASVPIRLLTLPPLQFLGKVSYSWYLWHWPAIVFAASLLGELSWRERLIVTAISGVPAIITHYAIEERFRRSAPLARRPRAALALGTGVTVGAVALGTGLSAAQPRIDLAPAADARGAAVARSEPLQTRATALRPTPEKAEEDRGQMFDDGCLVKGKTRESPDCVYGAPNGKVTVVLFGDSHALQYFPAVDALARKHGWRLVGLARASCPIADVDYQPTCNAWRANTMRRIAREKPDLVITSSATDGRFRVRVDGDRTTRTRSQPLLEEGEARTLRALQKLGAKVVAIRDQTRAPFTPANCVSAHPKQLTECVFPTTRHWDRDFVYRGARQVRGVKIIDPQPTLCPDGRCPSVIGNVVVYRDSYHMTATFAETLAPWLERRLPKL